MSEPEFQLQDEWITGKAREEPPRQRARRQVWHTIVALEPDDVEMVRSVGLAPAGLFVESCLNCRPDTFYLPEGSRVVEVPEEQKNGL